MPPKTVGSSKVETEPPPKIDFLKTSLPKIKSPRTLVLIHNLFGRVGKAGEGAESNALEWRNVGKRALPSHSCLVPDPPQGRVMATTNRTQNQNDLVRKATDMVSNTLIMALFSAT